MWADCGSVELEDLRDAKRKGLWRERPTIKSMSSLFALFSFEGFLNAGGKLILFVSATFANQHVTYCKHAAALASSRNSGRCIPS